MSSPWRKVEKENGCAFYINEITNCKQWDHPKYLEIKQRIDDCNYIKYASYRVASKIRILQQALFTYEVPLTIITGVFEKHRLGATESSLCLESYDLEAVLSDIYFAANKHNHTNIDVDFASELVLNFLYNIYDKDRKSNIDVCSTKLVLALLSNCKLIDLYKFIFSLCSDHNNCVTRLRLQSTLVKVSHITSYLNENATYGQQFINAAIEHCFNNSPGLVGVNESTFISWLENGPQIFSWLPVLHRLQLSETILHNVKCSVCKVSPFMGLKYKCTKCSRYIQCQRCFLSGRISHSHKIAHVMKEHCKESVSRDFTKGIKEKICGLLRCTYHVNGNISDLNIIDAKPHTSVNNDLLLKPSENDTECNVEPLSCPLSQLQVIIKQLELQNRELQQVVLLGTRSEKEMKRYLEEHRMHVGAQINKLKMLKDYMNTSSNANVPIMKASPVESTPMVSNGRTLTRGLHDFISPIAQIPELTLSDKLHKIPSFDLDKSTKDCNDSDIMPYSIGDISSWIGGRQVNLNSDYPLNIGEKNDTNPPVQTDLDDALAKLQQILANNFSLDESLGNVDNCHLKHAVNEVEGMLSSIIDNVDCNKINNHGNELMGSYNYN